MRRLTLTLSFLLVGTFAAGCSSFKLKTPPPGFAEVSAYGGSARYKSGDDVGINVSTFHNVKGGTLAFWSEDMIEKLGNRGYVLKKQSPVASKNGVVGTRFDFVYVPPTSDDEEKFYSAVLFVSDHYRVVIQVAGESALASKYDAQTTQVAQQIVIRGCKGRDICRGPQPAALSTPGPAVIATGGDDEEPREEPPADTAGDPPADAPDADPDPKKSSD